MTNKHDFLRQFEEQIQNWSSEIKKMEAHVEKAQADAKLQYQDNLKQMREERNKAQEKLQEIQQAGDGAWDDMQKGAEDTWKVLENSFNRALSRFK